MAEKPEQVLPPFAGRTRAPRTSVNFHAINAAVPTIDKSSPTPGL
jgi:hypothetical protein